MEEIESKCNYFTQFMKEIIKELKEEKTCQVFTKEQVEVLKEVFTNAIIRKNDLGYLVRL